MSDVVVALEMLWQCFKSSFLFSKVLVEQVGTNRPHRCSMRERPHNMLQVFLLLACLLQGCRAAGWQSIWSQSATATGSSSQPSIRYGHATDRHGSKMLMTLGYGAVCCATLKSPESASDSASCSHRFRPAATSMTGTKILRRGCLTRGSWTCTHPMRGTAWMAASLKTMLSLRTAAVPHPMGPAAGLDIRQRYTMTPCTSMAGTTAASAGMGARYGWSSTVNPLQPDILALSATRQLHTALSVHLKSLATVQTAELRARV